MLNKKMIFFATPPEGEKVGIDWYEHWRRKPTAEKTYGATPLSNLTAFELIRPKVIKVDEMITHRFPLKEIAEGFRVASEGKNCLKVIIKGIIPLDKTQDPTTGQTLCQEHRVLR